MFALQPFCTGSNKDVSKKLNDSSSQVKNISWLFIQVTKGHSIYHLTKTMMRRVTYKTSSKVSISSSFDFSTIAIAVRCRPVAGDICIFIFPFTKSILNCWINTMTEVNYKYVNWLIIRILLYTTYMHGA